MAQMAGNTSIKYFLPDILKGLGVERKTSLMIGGIESTIKIAFTVFDSWLVGRYGRVRTLVVSCLIMGVALMVRLGTSFPLTLLMGL